MTLITSLTMPRTAMAVLMICGAGLALGGCSDFRKAIGEEKSSPDEFEVVVRPTSQRKGRDREAIPAPDDLASARREVAALILQTAALRRRQARQEQCARDDRKRQVAAALVLPLLTYKVAAIVQRVQLQWYLDASIALATSALLVYAAS